MEKDVTTILSFVSIAFGVLLYLASVLGLFYDNATPPADIGLLSTVLVFVLFGVFGILLSKARAEAAN
ncbi:MAG: hypothetical protein ACPGQL_08265 [Thermoplasmatota archaeon]